MVDHVNSGRDVTLVTLLHLATDPRKSRALELTATAGGDVNGVSSTRGDERGGEEEQPCEHQQRCPGADLDGGHCSHGLCGWRVSSPGSDHPSKFEIQSLRGKLALGDALCCALS